MYQQHEQFEEMVQYEPQHPQSMFSGSVDGPSAPFLAPEGREFSFPPDFDVPGQKLQTRASHVRGAASKSERLHLAILSSLFVLVLYILAFFDAFPGQWFIVATLFLLVVVALNVYWNRKPRLRRD